MQKGSWTPQQNYNKKQNVVMVKKRYKDTNNNKKKKSVESAKPEWLKQWTISKGWMHNRSHLLNLGLEDGFKEEEAAVGMETPKVNKKIWDEDKSSSVSIEDIDDLLSLSSDVDATDHNLEKIETLPLEVKTKEDNDLLFEELTTNYRRNFPDHFTKYNDDLRLPEIYKERLLSSKNSNFLTEFWDYMKPKRKIKENKNCKFTINQLYDCREEDNQRKAFKSTLGQNIALYNTLNAKTNLLDDTIYECSEDSNNSLYHNPIYTQTQDNQALIPKYYDFHTNHVYRTDSFVRRRYRLTNHKFTNSMKYRTKTEKYIIRHIKVRIMLSLRIGRFQKFYSSNKKEINSGRQALLFKSGVECCENFCEEQSSLRRRIVRAHEEQRRIGNGRTSMKLQNMRYISEKRVFFMTIFHILSHGRLLIKHLTFFLNFI